MFFNKKLAAEIVLNAYKVLLKRRKMNLRIRIGNLSYKVIDRKNYFDFNAESLIRPISKRVNYALAYTNIFAVEKM